MYPISGTSDTMYPVLSKPCAVHGYMVMIYSFKDAGVQGMGYVVSHYPLSPLSNVGHYTKRL